ncbi:MAG TPA: hypothetical protein VIA29_09970 [Thermoanaerobaculia bacterium]
MIVYERSAAPAVRAAEWEIAGRRASARLMPYVGDAGTGARFDPLELRFLPRRGDARLQAGPSDPGAWEDAARRLPAGPLLLGPGCPAEEIHGSLRAALEGALRAGRGAYLLDAPAGVLPGGGAAAKARLGGAGDITALVSWTADGSWEGLLSTAASGSAPSGLLYPLFPGWTAQESVFSAALDAAAARGARFAVPLRPADDGDARRQAVEALSGVDPAGADRLFERLHHRDWASELPAAEAVFAREASRRGLTILPPRPVWEGESAGNANAADRLERVARERRENEPLSARYLAAARWVDECGRDLAAIHREGNFRKIFPFDGEIAAAAQAALGGSR